MLKQRWIRISGLLPLLAVLALAPACGDVDMPLEESSSAGLSTAPQEAVQANPPECKDRVCVRKSDCTYGAGGPNPIDCGSCQSNGYCSLSGRPVPTPTE